jgi:hypothetical protein
MRIAIHLMATDERHFQLLVNSQQVLLRASASIAGCRWRASMLAPAPFATSRPGAIGRAAGGIREGSWHTPLFAAAGQTETPTGKGGRLMLLSCSGRGVS